MTRPCLKVLKIVAHLAALAGLWLLCLVSLYLGLQVDPTYGNVGVLTTVVLAALYVYFGLVRGAGR